MDHKLFFGSTNLFRVILVFDVSAFGQVHQGARALFLMQP